MFVFQNNKSELYMVYQTSPQFNDTFGYFRFWTMSCVSHPLLHVETAWMGQADRIMGDFVHSVILEFFWFADTGSTKIVRHV